MIYNLSNFSMNLQQFTPSEEDILNFLLQDAFNSMSLLAISSILIIFSISFLKILTINRLQKREYIINEIPTFILVLVFIVVYFYIRSTFTGLLQ